MWYDTTMKRYLVNIIIIVLAVSAFLFVGKQNYIQDPKDVSVKPVVSTQTGSPAPDSVVAPTSLGKAECIANMKREVEKNKTTYEKGSVIVSFARGTSRASAEAILADHKMTLNPSAQNNFTTQAWGVVSVPSGKEFETICLLKSETRIKYAGINPILQLHE